MKELKRLKGLLKKRTELTLSTLVIFLITGNIGYGIDIYEDFINEDFINEDNQTALYLKNDNLNITNRGSISGHFVESLTFSDLGNGINAKDIGHIRNSGIISGVAISSSGTANSGNGISSDGSIKSINNSGIISGVAQVTNGGTNNGNGIVAKEIGDISNSGIISGSEYNGNGIESGSIVGILTNSGIISGSSTSINSTFENNGLYLKFGKFYKTNLEDVSNSGIISGTSVLTGGSGIKMYSMSFESINIGSINNNGIISGFSSTSATSTAPFANGISLDGSRNV
ncbi:MAG: hypothetical protein ACRCZO_06435, partial [Cetobacterium sp.]